MLLACVAAEHCAGTESLRGIPTEAGEEGESPWLHQQQHVQVRCLPCPAYVPQPASMPSLGCNTVIGYSSFLLN